MILIFNHRALQAVKRKNFILLHGENIVSSKKWNVDIKVSELWCFVDSPGNAGYRIADKVDHSVGKIFYSKGTKLINLSCKEL